MKCGPEVVVDVADDVVAVVAVDVCVVKVRTVGRVRRCRRKRTVLSFSLYVLFEERSTTSSSCLATYKLLGTK